VANNFFRGLSALFDVGPAHHPNRRHLEGNLDALANRLCRINLPEHTASI
jgi:hypothetical protein